MTESEEKNYWRRYKENGDQSARDALIVHYMRMVKFIAGRMAIHVPSNVEMGDLTGWGIMGLLDAVEKFDIKQDVKFSTYASIRIRGAIIDQIRSLDWAPRSLRQMARKVGGARERLRHTLGREPTVEEMAADIGSTPEQVADTIGQIQTAQVLSLDDYLPTEDSSDARKVDVTFNPAAPNPMQAAEMNERQERIVKAILELPDQQQKVLNLYYYEELTLKEIGAVLEVTESRISQIHSAAMKRLRQVIRAQE